MSIFFSDSHTLLLYASKKVAFWDRLSAITKYPINNKDQKLWLLKSHKIAIASIKEDKKIIDINTLLEKHSHIKNIIYLGKKSKKLYQLHFDNLKIPNIHLSSSNKISKKKLGL